MKSPINGVDTDQNFAHHVLDPYLTAHAAAAPVHPARAEPTPRRAQGVFYTPDCEGPTPEDCQAELPLTPQPKENRPPSQASPGSS
jgi:hypothetical protein